jgi:hypothetical protein
MRRARIIDISKSSEPMSRQREKCSLQIDSGSGSVCSPVCLQFECSVFTPLSEELIVRSLPRISIIGYSPVNAYTSASNVLFLASLTFAQWEIATDSVFRTST